MYLALEAMSKEMQESRHCLQSAGNGIPEKFEKMQETEENHEAIGAPAERMETVAEEIPGVLLGKELVRGDALWVDDGETEV